MVRHALIAVAAAAAAFVACSGGSGGGARGGAGSVPTGGAGSASGGGSAGGAPGIRAPAGPSPLAIALLTPAGTESGHVEVEYLLAASPALAAAIRAEYSTDGGARWAPATEGIGSGGTVSVPTGAPPGARRTFVWDSFADLGETFAPATRVRLTATASGQPAAAGETADFPLNNGTADARIALARGPYVQDVTPSSAVIVWRTTSALPGAVEWGETPALGRYAAGAASAVDHEVTLSGLLPGSLVYYRVLAGGAPLAPVERFRAAAGPGQTSFRFLVFGDSGKGNREQWAVAQRMEMTDADFSLHVGDIVYQDGQPEGYDPRFFSPYRKMLARAPVFPALGNHDIQTALGQPFLDAFVLPRSSGSERYYTFSWGHAQFFCLETSQPYLVAPYLPQHTWFVNELARSTATWKFVFFHHPPYSSGGHGSETFVRSVLGPHIEQAEVDLVFNGHDHHYERTGVRRDYAPTGRGTRYVITGAAGAVSTSGHGPSSFTAAMAAEAHFLRVSVDANVLRAEAIRPDGTVIDAFDIVR